MYTFIYTSFALHMLLILSSHPYIFPSSSGNDLNGVSLGYIVAQSFISTETFSGY